MSSAETGRDALTSFGITVLSVNDVHAASLT